MEGKKRKVDSENRQFNKEWEEKFFFVEHNGKVLCLICKKTVALPKKGNVERHYSTCHGSMYNSVLGEARREMISQLKKTLQNQQLFVKKMTSNTKAVTHASYEISTIIAKKLKPFSDGEYIKECIAKFVETCCPEKKGLVEKLTLSDSTVTRRVESLAKDVHLQLKDTIAGFEYFSLALDGSKDITDVEQLAIYVRGVDKDLKVTEEMLELRAIHASAKGEDVFREFLAAFNAPGLVPEKLFGIATDGAPNMLVPCIGLRGHVERWLESLELPTVIWYHCIIHQEALCAKTLRMNHVMDVVVSTVNFIRARGINHHEFKKMLDVVEAEYGDVLYFTVHWLSRGAVLHRFSDMMTNISAFMEAKQHPVTELEDPDWLRDLAFLVDITTHLNILNCSLQRHDMLVHQLYSTVCAFIIKLRLWKCQLSENNFTHFKELSKHTNTDGSKYAAIINDLEGEFNFKFSEFKKQEQNMEIFAQPFSVDIMMAPDHLQMELVELQANMDLKGRFQMSSILEFYQKLPASSFPELRKHACKFISLFGSTYICESTFSSMKYAKSKYRSRLTGPHLEQCLRLGNSRFVPRVDKIVDRQKRLHCSHTPDASPSRDRAKNDI
uniref:General transcription factor II-I repeat domain-containing protein 2-like n=1 Tax=Eptatretus burgeri TaxID=7764 RepID=A0A8C4X0U4_EPTBU